LLAEFRSVHAERSQISLRVMGSPSALVVENPSDVIAATR
jgi:hypothetical protein